MNAKKLIATGCLVATMGLGPLVASAEGLYFAVSGGITSHDIDRGALDASYEPILENSLAFVVDGDPVDDVFTGTVTGYNSGSVDDSGIGWGVQAGYEFTPYVAVEVGYVDLGKTRQEDGSIAANYTSLTAPGTLAFTADASTRIVSSGPTLAAVGKFPFGSRFSAHGKAGVYFADTRVRVKYDGNIAGLVPSGVAAPFEFKAGTQELFIGLGGGFEFNDSWGMRVELQRFFDVGDDNDTGEVDMDMFTFGIVFR